MAEKTSEKTVCMPTYSTLVAQAAGNRARQEILPASKIRMVNHQKPVAQTRPAVATAPAAGVPEPGPGPAGQQGGGDQHDQPGQPEREVFDPPVRQVEGLLVDLLERGGRGDPAEHEERHRGGPGHGAGGGRL